MTTDVKSTAALPLPHPARLSARLDPGLSRWLWLVKWLLALPHYLVPAFLWLAVVPVSVMALRALTGLLTLYAGIALAITDVYPRGIFDLVIGLNRWALRVAVYAALLTDTYPPFRLDQGGAEPVTA